MIARIVACCAALLLFGAAPAPRSPLWSRSLPAGPPVADLQLTIVDDAVALVRSGYSLIGLDVATGKTRWSVPNADAVAIAGNHVVVARNATVFAVRPTDAGVLWTHPCSPGAFLVAWRDRIATLCSGRIAILRATDGETLASSVVPRAETGRTYHAVTINGRYFALAHDVELQTRFSVIDGRSGAVRWSKDSSEIVNAGPTWIDVTPAQAQTAWAPAGTVERRNLANGKLLGTHAYRFGVATDDHGTPLFASTAAMYAIAGNGELYRAPLNGTEMSRVTPESGAVVGPTVLGESAFYGTMPNGTAATATMYVDRPERNTFKETALGSFDAVAAVRGAGHVAFKRDNTVVLYRASGDLAATLRASCPTIGAIAASAQRYVLLCTAKTASSIMGFPRS